MSPMRFVKEVRLDAARTLLLSNGIRASEVALHVGYESPAHFSRDFKRRFGTSPARYARRLAEQGAMPTSRSTQRVMPS
jgi:AraC-like DNA-binding protein